MTLDELEDEYDLIISNPSLFRRILKCTKTERDLARFEDAMPFEDLLKPQICYLVEMVFWWYYSI
jgi:tRNA1Val (adenine37-N6)-methyltransferase